MKHSSFTLFLLNSNAPQETVAQSPRAQAHQRTAQEQEEPEDEEGSRDPPSMGMGNVLPPSQPQPAVTAVSHDMPTPI